MKRCVLSIVVLLSTAGWATAHTVGFATHTFTYQTADGTSKEMRVAMWYPSSGSTSTVVYAYVSGQVVPDGAVLDGPWPLVVHSHGAWSCGLSSAYLNQSLAAAGYVIAAPDHEDAASCLIGGGQAPYADWTQTMGRRPEELRAVIDEVFELNRTPGSAFHGKIDELKVSASGHSLGGWAAGTLSPAHATGDSRVKTLLLWSPSARLDQSFYGQLQSPVMYLFGQYDATAFSSAFRTWAYDATPPPKFLSYVAAATHYSFTDLPCQFYRTVENCSNNPTAATILRYSRAFLDWYLKDDQTTNSILKTMELYER